MNICGHFASMRTLPIIVLAGLSACTMQPAVTEPDAELAAPTVVNEDVPQMVELEAPPPSNTPSAIATTDATGEQPNINPKPPTYKLEDVIWIQSRLQELGYYSGEVDGSAGSATRKAIQAYQVDQGVEPEGRPTSELREFMWRNGG